jgi:hypothetical protein
MKNKVEIINTYITPETSGKVTMESENFKIEMQGWARITLNRHNFLVGDDADCSDKDLYFRGDKCNYQLIERLRAEGQDYLVEEYKILDDNIQTNWAKLLHESNRDLYSSVFNLDKVVFQWELSEEEVWYYNSLNILEGFKRNHNHKYKKIFAKQSLGIVFTEEEIAENEYLTEKELKKISKKLKKKIQNAT